MHISEGILSAPVLGTGALVTAGLAWLGLRRIDYDQIVHVAILASAFFVASLIHVNIGPASVHLILNGLVGLLLGLAAVPAILTALILQALFFQYGGLTALGVNALIMALPAVLVHYLFCPLLGRSHTLNFTAGCLAGCLAVGLSCLLLAGALVLTEAQFLATSMAVITANLPVIAIEGIVTGFSVSFLARVYPDILPRRHQ